MTPWEREQERQEKAWYTFTEVLSGIGCALVMYAVIWFIFCS